MEPRLSLQISQRLILTPTLQQAIKLLQYSRLELVQFVRQELLENPTLEELQSSPEDGEVPAPADQEPRREEADGGDEQPEMPDLEGPLMLGETSGSFEPASAAEAPSYENVVSVAETLQEHLTTQLGVAARDEEERLIGYEIIGNIDDFGYLRASAEEIARDCGADPAAVEEAIALVQDFDPPGVGAQDLRECLLLQLRQGHAGSLAERIVADRLDDLEGRRLKKIARAERVSLEEVVEAARIISRLEPRPGRAFSQETTQYVTPDIHIYKVDDDYQVRLVEEGIPRLRINNFYRRLFRSGRLGAADKEFLNKKVNSARWLIKSIIQRQETILKVARSIVKFQWDFLDHGVGHLRPLVLRTVAEDIQMHESTVSRVTSKKYAQTPQGLFELKYFFNSGIDRRNGGSMASASVQEIIQKIIAAEDTAKPLSDLEIVRRLDEEHDLKIARRTVAKYRSLLHILPANRRRRAY